MNPEKEPPLAGFTAAKSPWTFEKLQNVFSEYSNTDELIVIPIAEITGATIDFLTESLRPIVQGEVDIFASDLLPYLHEDQTRFKTLVVIKLSYAQLPRVVAALPLMIRFVPDYWELSPERMDSPDLRITGAKVAAFVLAVTRAYQRHNFDYLQSALKKQNRYAVSDEIFYSNDPDTSAEDTHALNTEATEELLCYLRSRISFPVRVIWIPEDMYPVFYNQGIFLPGWAMAALFQDPAIANHDDFPPQFAKLMPLELLHVLVQSHVVIKDAQELNGTERDLDPADFTSGGGVLLYNRNGQVVDKLILEALDDRVFDEHDNDQ